MKLKKRNLFFFAVLIFCLGKVAQANKLDLSWQNITNEELSKVAQANPELTEIKLWFCNSITVAGLRELQKYCKSLKSIDVSDSDGIAWNDFELRKFKKEFPTIRIIDNSQKGAVGSF